MSRPRYTFRPSLQRDSHRKAWEALQSVPKGQRNEFLVRAILWMQEDAVLEETIRRTLLEELGTACPRPESESTGEKALSEARSSQPIPQEMIGFLNELMKNG